MSECKDEDPRIRGISSSIRVVPNFPKPGIMFQDITTLLLDSKAFKNTIDLFVERYKGKNISVVAGVEARGFIFGPPIALAIGAKFVPLRKPRKLPGEVISEEYVLEYGRDCLEMHIGAVEPGERALVVDDLIATGGTLCAAMNLLEQRNLSAMEKKTEPKHSQRKKKNQARIAVTKKKKKKVRKKKKKVPDLRRSSQGAQQSVLGLRWLNVLV